MLTGAFFFGRTELIQKIGGFDEDFFMYGEDVDLSHRVQLEGKDLHYLGGTTIIHYKGESTKKRSLTTPSASLTRWESLQKNTPFAVGQGS